jgi:hypothetical protein
MKVICDKCSKYVVSQCGTTESCFAKFEGSKQVIRMDEIYINQRMNGEKQNCKSFQKL